MLVPWLVLAPGARLAQAATSVETYHGSKQTEAIRANVLNDGPGSPRGLRGHLKLLGQHGYDHEQHAAVDGEDERGEQTDEDRRPRPVLAPAPGRCGGMGRWLVVVHGGAGAGISRPQDRHPRGLPAGRRQGPDRAPDASLSDSRCPTRRRPIIVSL